jgi:hypothetical protein
MKAVVISQTAATTPIMMPTIAPLDNGGDFVTDFLFLFFCSFSSFVSTPENALMVVPRDADGEVEVAVFVVVLWMGVMVVPPNIKDSSDPVQRPSSIEASVATVWRFVRRHFIVLRITNVFLTLGGCASRCADTGGEAGDSPARAEAIHVGWGAPGLDDAYFSTFWNRGHLSVE